MAVTDLGAIPPLQQFTIDAANRVIQQINDRIVALNTTLASLAEGGALILTANSLTPFPGDQHDVPVATGITLLRVQATAATVISGFDAGTAGRFLVLANVGQVAIDLENDGATSFDQNRIYTGTGANVTIAPNAGRLLVYDGLTTRWRLIG